MTLCTTCRKANVSCPVYPQDTMSCVEYAAKPIRVFMHPTECKHGHLARSCDFCSLEAEVQEWKDRCCKEGAAKIAALEAEVARLESVVDRLRGQLQNCVAHLERANRRQFKQEYSPAIESANRALYETLVEGGGR